METCISEHFGESGPNRIERESQDGNIKEGVSHGRDAVCATEYKSSAACPKISSGPVTLNLKIPKQDLITMRGKAAIDREQLVLSIKSKSCRPG